LLKESTTEDAQKVVELAGGIQELVVVDDLLKIAEGVPGRILHVQKLELQKLMLQKPLEVTLFLTISLIM
jgi:thiamine monophosphate synthase